MTEINTDIDIYEGWTMEFYTEEGETDTTESNPFYVTSVNDFGKTDTTESNPFYFTSMNDFGESDTTESNPFYVALVNDFGETENSSRSLNCNLITTIIAVQVKDINYPQDMIAFGAICMILFGVLAIVGNFISIWALSKSKRLRRVTTAFIVNLCVANFFLSCSTLTSSVVIYRTLHWNGGDRTCKFYYVLIIFFDLVAMLTVTTITLNRYVLIVHPRYYHAIFSIRNTGIMIGSLWTASMVLVLLRFFKICGEFGYDLNSGECAKIDSRGHVQTYMFILTYIVPFIVFILCYAKMFFVVRRIERNTSKHGGNIIAYVTKLGDKYWLQEQENDSDGTNYKYLRNEKERRLFKMIFVMFVCFILCFIPVSAMKISRKQKEYPSVYILCHLGLHLSSVVNPIIYILMSKEYRKAYTDLFRCSAKNRRDVEKCREF